MTILQWNQRAAFNSVMTSEVIIVLKNLTEHPCSMRWDVFIVPVKHWVNLVTI